MIFPLTGPSVDIQCPVADGTRKPVPRKQKALFTHAQKKKSEYPGVSKAKFYFGLSEGHRQRKHRAESRKPKKLKRARFAMAKDNKLTIF